MYSLLQFYIKFIYSYSYLLISLNLLSIKDLLRCNISLNSFLKYI